MPGSDHCLQDFGRLEAIAVSGRQRARDVEPDIEPDDVTQSQRADGVTIGQHSGPIDIVGAGDSVTANLALALAAGATIREAMTLAMAAASIVIHQLGTTGTASVADLSKHLGY